jgi:hypothetical protein
MPRTVFFWTVTPVMLTPSTLPVGTAGHDGSCVMQTVQLLLFPAGGWITVLCPMIVKSSL